MFGDGEARQPGQFGWLSKGNALSVIAGLAIGGMLMVIFPSIGGRGERAPATAALATAVVQSSDPAAAPPTAAAVVLPDTPPAEAVLPASWWTNDRLRARSLARPVRFGDATDPGPGQLAAWEEQALAGALAIEESAAVQPADQKLVLTARSRARPVRFGDSVLTAKQEAFVRLQEWWAAEVSATSPPAAS